VKSRRSVVMVTLLLTVLMFCWLEIRIASHASNLGGTDSRLISLLIGALAGMGLFWRIYPQLFLTSKYFDVLAAVSAIAAVALASQFSLDSTPSHRVLPWFAVSVAVFVVWSATRSRSAAHLLLTSRPLVWIGQVSYGLYLWHHFFVALVRDVSWPLSIKLGVGIAGSLIVTTVSYYLLERPFLRLKDRFKIAAPALSGTNAAGQGIPVFSSAEEPISS